MTSGRAPDVLGPFCPAWREPGGAFLCPMLAHRHSGARQSESADRDWPLRLLVGFRLSRSLSSSRLRPHLLASAEQSRGNRITRRRCTAQAWLFLTCECVLGNTSSLRRFGYGDFVSSLGLETPLPSKAAWAAFFFARSAARPPQNAAGFAALIGARRPLPALTSPHRSPKTTGEVNPGPAPGFFAWPAASQGVAAWRTSSWSAPNGATRARARSSTGCPSRPTWSCASRAATTPAIPSSSATRPTSCRCCPPASCGRASSP